MIATRGQLVRLTPTARAMVAHLTRPGYDNDAARVLSLVYTEQPEGERGVQLDRSLGESRWWAESDLEPAE